LQAGGHRFDPDTLHKAWGVHHIELGGVVEVWPKDWSLQWARGSVGSPIKLFLSIFVVIALVLIEFIWPRIFVHTSVILAAMLIYAFFSMRGLYKRLNPPSGD
jgi:hypothetical protein